MFVYLHLNGHSGHEVNAHVQLLPDNHHHHHFSCFRLESVKKWQTVVLSLLLPPNLNWVSRQRKYSQKQKSLIRFQTFSSGTLSSHLNVFYVHANLKITIA